MEELKRFLNPLFFVIVIISFFLPFFNITCQQQKIASITGFELITGTTITTNGLNKGITGLPQNEQNAAKNDTVSAEPLAWIVLLLAIGGLIISFYEKYSDIGSAVTALLGGLSLIFLNSTITDNVLGKTQYQPLAVECGTGYYIVLILFILLLVYNAYLFVIRSLYKPEEKVLSYGAQMRFCPQCGSENDMVSIYCNTCGSKM